jgi:hypothetical protein
MGSVRLGRQYGSEPQFLNFLGGIADNRVPERFGPSPHNALRLFGYRVAQYSSRRPLGNCRGCFCFLVSEACSVAAGRCSHRFVLASVAPH